MGLNLYIRSDKEEMDDSFSVCGQSEAADYWIPYAEQEGLELLIVAFTGGLQVSTEHYEPLKKQIAEVYQHLQHHFSNVKTPENPLFRCRRLLEKLSAFHPSTYRIYLG